MTSGQREKAEVWIKDNCLVWGIGKAGVAVINRKGLVKATEMAFRRAIDACSKNLESRIVNSGKKAEIHNSQFKIQFLLVDAFYLPYIRGLRRKNQMAIIKGDEQSFSIAAASIVAKVYRDRLMQELSKTHKKYGWEKNKGYGTKEHQDAIKRYGVTRLHRKAWKIGI